MDAFDFDNVKAEKAKAMLRYNRLRTLAKLFRLVEISLALVFLSWISAWLPSALRISGEYFRHLIAVIVSPLFIFVVGNAIVITLLAKSGQFSGPTSAIDNAGTNLYDEIIKDRDSGINWGPENHLPASEPEEIVYQDKQVISELNVVAEKCNGSSIVQSDTVPDLKSFRRSQSESFERESPEKPCGKLRRSETEKCMKVGGVQVDAVCLVDELSSEEFQRAVEEFIAKQLKFHQEEKLAIVTC